VWENWANIKDNLRYEADPLQIKLKKPDGYQPLP
jgi:hypothetical protein